MIDKMDNTQEQAKKEGYTKKELKDLRKRLRKAKITMDAVANAAGVHSNYPPRIFSGGVSIDNWRAAEKARRVVEAAETLLSKVA